MILHAFKRKREGDGVGRPGLVVNKATPDKERITINAQVAKGAIRRENRNGREVFVVSSKTLPFGVVMNGGLYTREQIERNYKRLDNTFAPLGHPMVNGEPVSAFSPEGINLCHVGAHNEAARIEGNRVALEKVVDIEVASRTENGRTLLNRLKQLEKGEGEPIHTSVAVWATRDPAPADAKGYEWVANIIDIDHDAILLDEPGAATPDQGVGLAVNADQATTLEANAGALLGLSFRERERMLEVEARRLFKDGDDDYVWIADFTDDQAIVVRNGGESMIHGYSLDNGKISISTDGDPVRRTESWVAVVANAAKRFFQKPTVNKEADMPLTAEDLAAIKAATAETIAPLTERVTAMEANHKALADTLTANSRAEEAAMREAVKAKLGEVIANSLQGEALKQMHAQLGTAATLAPNSAGGTGDKPDFKVSVD